MATQIDETFPQPTYADIHEAGYKTAQQAYWLGYRAAVIAAKVAIQDSIGRASDDPMTWSELLEAVREREAALERERNRVDSLNAELQSARTRLHAMLFPSLPNGSKSLEDCLDRLDEDRDQVARLRVVLGHGHGDMMYSRLEHMVDTVEKLVESTPDIRRRVNRLLDRKEYARTCDFVDGWESGPPITSLPPDATCAMLAHISRRTGKLCRLNELIEGWYVDALLPNSRTHDTPDEAVIAALEATKPRAQ
jgi:hypothetical protein